MSVLLKVPGLYARVRSRARRSPCELTEHAGEHREDQPPRHRDTERNMLQVARRPGAAQRRAGLRVSVSLWLVQINASA